MKFRLTSRLAIDSGDNPPLLFVHGTWHGAWCWDEHFLEAFANLGYDAHALDLTGHGGRDENVRFVGNSQYLDDIDAAVGELEGAPVVVGHSAGGYLVQRYLETHEVAGAVLLGSVPPSGALGVTLRTLRAHPSALLKTGLQMRLWPLVATPQLTRDLLMRSNATDDEAETFQARLQDDSFRAFLGMIMRRVKRSQFAPPVLVLGGDQDHVVSVKEVHATATRYDTDAVIVPGMTHGMMLDPDWRSLVEAMTVWLKGTFEA